MSTKPLPGRCPACGSTNIQAEPLYPYEDENGDDLDFGYPEDETGDTAVFCVSCGHYLGEMRSELTGRMSELRSNLADWLRQSKAD